MAASIRQNLSFSIFKHTSNTNVPSPVSLSLSLHFFSTQTPTHLDSNINPTVYDILVHKHDFPRDFASGIASKLSHVKNPEVGDSMLTFLKSSGLSNAQLQKVLNYKPRYLYYSLEDNIKPKFKSFQEDGFSSDDISKIISTCPTILAMNLNNNIIPSLSVLKGLLGSNSALIRLVRMYPRILTSNMERTVLANVEFLKSIGVSMNQIRIILIAQPPTLSYKPQVIRAAVKKAEEMGLTASSKAFVYAILTIAAMTNEAWELKLQAFQEMGFSESDILSMFRKEPRAFCASTAKIKKLTKGLLATGKFDISAIVRFPGSFTYSFEKRYEPRLRIIGILGSRNLIENWPALATLSQLTDAEFRKRFVSPYSDHLSDVLHPKV